jgi:hypothetical protein
MERKQFDELRVSLSMLELDCKCNVGYTCHNHKVMGDVANKLEKLTWVYDDLCNECDELMNVVEAADEFQCRHQQLERETASFELHNETVTLFEKAQRRLQDALIDFRKDYPDA